MYRLNESGWARVLVCATPRELAARLRDSGTHALIHTPGRARLIVSEALEDCVEPGIPILLRMGTDPGSFRDFVALRARGHEVRPTWRGADRISLDFSVLLTTMHCRTATGLLIDQLLTQVDPKYHRHLIAAIGVGRSRCSVAELSQALSLSDRAVRDAFRIIGPTPREALAHSFACHALAYAAFGQFRGDEVAALMGYQQVRAFGRAFRRTVGAGLGCIDKTGGVGRAIDAFSRLLRTQRP